MTTPHLFSEFTLKDVTLRNRIGVSPMCQYSSEDGVANDWHLVLLGSRAAGGAALVICEATAVTADGRISPQDAGLWNDAQIEPLARITRFIAAQGAVAGIQLAHAGRKASTGRPWEGGGQLDEAHGGWLPRGPSPLAFLPETERVPHALSAGEIKEIVSAFAAAAERSLSAGYRWMELHGAHGYLVHEFLSPLSNLRTDEYGGSFENRIRFALEVTRAVRAVWPESLPLTWRISATDWVAGGWTPEDSVRLARHFKAEGVDLVDCSSGANTPHVKIPIGPGYQVHLAEEVRRGADIPTAAVGMITEAQQADAIIREGRADLVFLARELLRNPHWPLYAARELDAAALKNLVPPQYARSF
jgi:2,4-dienoyl-CoA reductase-like NADH-dependent reductase (Old Yellow Enzyme family)